MGKIKKIITKSQQYSEDMVMVHVDFEDEAVKHVYIHTLSPGGSGALLSLKEAKVLFNLLGEALQDLEKGDK